MELECKMISKFSLLMLRAPRAKLKAEICKLPRKPTVKQQLKVAQMHACLGKQVKDFLDAETVFLPALEEGDFVAFQEKEVIDTPADEAVEPEDLDVDETVDESTHCTYLDHYLFLIAIIFPITSCT